MSNKKDNAEEEIEMEDLNKKRGQADKPDEPFVASDSDQGTDEEFNLKQKKYNQISRQIRLEAIEKEKKELEKSEKSPENKYYLGTKSDRIKLLEEEKELLEKMEKITETKRKQI